MFVTTASFGLTFFRPSAESRQLESSKTIVSFGRTVPSSPRTGV